MDWCSEFEARMTIDQVEFKEKNGKMHHEKHEVNSWRKPTPLQIGIRYKYARYSLETAPQTVISTFRVFGEEKASNHKKVSLFLSSFNWKYSALFKPLLCIRKRKHSISAEKQFYFLIILHRLQKNAIKTAFETVSRQTACGMLKWNCFQRKKRMNVQIGFSKVQSYV